MAFGKNIQDDNGVTRKLHELEMRLNGIEHVYLKDLEKKIVEVAMNAGVTKEVAKKAAKKRGK